jgi:chorismate mutase / prephenate dehydratase
MAPRNLDGDVPSVSLEGLRREIDRVDDALLVLVQRRLAIAREMAPLKRTVSGLALRPRRERAILRRLRAAAPSVPESLVRTIWRELMSHGLQAQRPIELVLYGEKLNLLTALARQRFGSAAPALAVDSPAEALEAALSGNAICIIEAESWPQLHDPRLRRIETFRCWKGSPLAYAAGCLASES